MTHFKSNARLLVIPMACNVIHVCEAWEVLFTLQLELWPCNGGVVAKQPFLGEKVGQLSESKLKGKMHTFSIAFCNYPKKSFFHSIFKSCIAGILNQRVI